MRAVLAVHGERYSEAAALIEQTRRHLDGNIRALLAESYGRAYVPLIMVQQCSELEEITEYKMLLREAGMSAPAPHADAQLDVYPSGPLGSPSARRNSDSSGHGGNGSGHGAVAAAATYVQGRRTASLGNGSDYLLVNTSSGLSPSSSPALPSTPPLVGVAQVGYAQPALSPSPLPPSTPRSLPGRSLPCQVDYSGGMTGRGPVARFTASVPRGPRSKSALACDPYRGETSPGDGSTRPGSRRARRGYSISSPTSHGERSWHDPRSSQHGGGGGNSGGGDDGQSAALDANVQALRAEVAKRKTLLTEKWRRRIRGCCSSGRAAIPVWKYLLNGRRMVLSEREDLDTWLEFASLCRNGGNAALAERVLHMAQVCRALLSVTLSHYDPPFV